MDAILDGCDFPKLKKMAEKMGLKIKRSKGEMIKKIKEAMQEFEEYKKEKLDRYTRIKKIGEGKEGTVYLVKDKKGKELVMKTFRPAKSSKTLKLEYSLQKKASKQGVCPKVLDYDTVSKYIVMEKLDEHFIDVVKKQKGEITKEQQKQILKLYEGLDKAEVLHGDANLANYMMKGDRIYLIDYGFAKPIDDKLKKKLKSKHPNSELMLTGIIIGLKELGLDKKSYKYLLKALPAEMARKYNLEEKKVK